MRSATKEERESVDRYIKSISHKTGVMFNNLTPKEKGDAFYEAGWECAIDRASEIISDMQTDILSQLTITVNSKANIEWACLEEAKEKIKTLRGGKE